MRALDRIEIDRSSGDATVYDRLAKDIIEDSKVQSITMSNRLEFSKDAEGHSGAYRHTEGYTVGRTGEKELAMGTVNNVAAHLAVDTPVGVSAEAAVEHERSYSAVLNNVHSY